MKILTLFKKPKSQPDQLLESGHEISHFITRLNRMARAGIPFFFLIDFEKNNPLVLGLPEAHEQGFRFDIRGHRNYRIPPGFQPSAKALQPTPVDKKIYGTSFELVKEHLLQGNSYLVNLTFPTYLENQYSLEEIFYDARAPYRLLYPEKFVVFSPEPFVRINNGYIYSYPMKGTIDANLPNAEQAIMENEKEIFEHNTIVDLIRNDLAMVSDDVTVTRFRYVEKVKSNQKNLLQVSSEIRGTLKTDWKSNLAETLLKLLPAGSVSGAPKDKTLDIIRESELSDRGYYSGIFGLFDGSSIDSAVCIRFIEKNGDVLQYRSGGGITAMSTVEHEYKEMIDKIYVPTF